MSPKLTETTLAEQPVINLLLTEKQKVEELIEK